MTEVADVRDPHARRAVVLMERSQLEDKHLRLMEENLILKKHARSQEEKMKKMATKLLRLTSDEKKEVKRDGQWITGRQLDSGVEERLDDLQGKVRELEKQNMALKSKNMVLRQQLETRGKRHTHYDHIQSRISTGLAKRSQRSTSTDDISGKSSSKSAPVPLVDVGTQSSPSPSPAHAAPCHNLLEEVRRDNHQLEEASLQLRQELTVLRAENERLKEQVRLKSLRSEEEKLGLQEELHAQITALEKSAADEEVRCMKLQRELRDKTNRHQALQAKYNTLEQNIDVAKASHSRVLQEMELLNEQLKDERSRTSHLQSELRSKTVSQKAMSELQEMLGDLRSERDLLKQANDRLMKGDVERAEQQRGQLKSLQERTRQSEDSVRREREEKTTAIDRLARERELSEKLNSELTELRATYIKLKENHEQLQDKVKFYSKETSLDWSEVEEALALIREKKEKGEPVKSLSFLETLEDSKDRHVELQELRVAHADTINELEKTRKLLQLQHNINKDYKKEIESLKSLQEESRLKHSSELREYAQLLDIKATRVKKLEGQLKDIAYGTRQYKLDTSKFEYGSDGVPGIEESIELERGQNLLQFHISQVVLSPEAISQLHTPTPSVFVSLHYADYETQVTPVKQGARPCFNFTSNYVVTVNDSFLQSLQTGTLSLQVNQALGLKYQKLAASIVKVKELITSSGCKVHGKVVLTGVDSMSECVSVGCLEYWMRLKLPITQAVRLYQDRNKALSLVEDQSVSVAPSLLSAAGRAASVKGPDYNELVISISKCSNLKLNVAGHSPSPYVMYKFYTFPDHDTPILPHSTDPTFNNSKLFPVSMDTHLDSYLKKESLDVYLFDDSDEDESSYLVAQVPLLPLAQGRTNITNSYTLTEVSGAPAGQIDISLQWKHPYHIRQDPAPPHSSATTTTTERGGTTTQQPTDLKPSSGELPKVKVEETITDKGKKQVVVSDDGGRLRDAPVVSGQNETLKSDSKTSLGGMSSSSTILSESEESTTILSEESEVSLPERRKVEATPDVAAQHLVVAVQSKMKSGDELKKKAQSLTKNKKGITLTTTTSKGKKGKSIPLKNSLPPLTAKVPISGDKLKELQPSSESDRQEELVRKEETSAQRSLGDSSSDLVDVTDSEMSLMSGLNLGATEECVKESHTTQSGEQNGPKIENETKIGEVGGGGAAGEAGESGEDGDESLSVTVTELSGEEEVEEDLDESGEDTMFEETPHQSGDEAGVSSGLSDHSSDGLPPPPPSKPQHVPQPSSTSQMAEATESPLTDEEDNDEDDSDFLTPTSSESKLTNGKPITSQLATLASTVSDSKQVVPKAAVSSSHMTITVESFTLEDDCPIASDANITKLFVEYGFLDFEYGELETPSSLPKPPPGEAAVYSFRKDFYLNSDQERLLVSMLKPGDTSEGRITFTVVSDPENEDKDCEELGNAEVDLKMVFDSGKDLSSEAIDVYSVEEETEIIGYLVISVEISDFLRKLVNL